MGDTERRRSSESTENWSYKLTKTGAAYTGPPVQVCSRWVPRAERMPPCMPPSLTQKQSPVDNLLQRKI